METALEELLLLAEEIDEPLHRIALSWSVSNEAVTCTICGVRNRDQLLDNVRAVNLGLGRGFLEQLNTITEPLKVAMGTSPDYYESTAKSRTW